MISLPDDLLQRILEDFIQEYKDYWLSLIFERLRVRMVCRLWRNAVDTSFRFWDVLYIHLFTCPEFVKFCLSKIMSTQISLQICMETMLPNLPLPDGEEQPKSAPVHTFIEDTLALLQPRWPAVASLTLSADEEAEVAQAVGMLTKFHGGNLQRVIAAAMWNFGRGASNAWCAAELPSLCKLAITNGLPSDPQERVYSRIVALRLGCSWDEARMELGPLLDALSSAPFLRSQHFENVELVGRNENSAVSLFGLKEFRIDYTQPTSLVIMAHIRVSHLASFCLSIGYNIHVHDLLENGRHILAAADGLQLEVSAVCVSDLSLVLSKMTRLLWLELRGFFGVIVTAEWFEHLLLNSPVTRLDVSATQWVRRDGPPGGKSNPRWTWEGGRLRKTAHIHKGPRWMAGWNPDSRCVTVGDVEVDMSWVRAG